VLAFIVGGLREVGEPARKALIVDLAPMLPFYVATGSGLAGTLVFIATVDEEHAG
jgi:hypothetical protein